MSYNIMKLLHIIFTVLFLGNIIVAIFWKLFADRTGNPGIIAHTLKGIIKADKIFTMPGVIGLVIFGFGAAGIGHYPILESDWILWSIVLFIISGAAFMAGVSPLQKKMLALAESSSFDKKAYAELSGKWNIWGLIATIAPIIAVVLMVFKPV